MRDDSGTLLLGDSPAEAERPTWLTWTSVPCVGPMGLCLSHAQPHREERPSRPRVPRRMIMANGHSAPRLSPNGERAQPGHHDCGSSLDAAALRSPRRLRTIEIAIIVNTVTRSRSGSSPMRVREHTRTFHTITSATITVRSPMRVATRRFTQLSSCFAVRLVPEEAVVLVHETGSCTLKRVRERGDEQPGEWRAHCTRDGMIRSRSPAVRLHESDGERRPHSRSAHQRAPWEARRTCFRSNSTLHDRLLRSTHAELVAAEPSSNVGRSCRLV